MNTRAFAGTEPESVYFYITDEQALSTRITDCVETSDLQLRFRKLPRICIGYRESLRPVSHAAMVGLVHPRGTTIRKITGNLELPRPGLSIERPTQHGTPILRVTTHEVVIDLLAVDGHDRAIHDLTAGELP